MSLLKSFFEGILEKFKAKENNSKLSEENQYIKNNKPNPLEKRAEIQIST